MTAKTPGTTKSTKTAAATGKLPTAAPEAPNGLDTSLEFTIGTLSLRVVGEGIRITNHKVGGRGKSIDPEKASGEEAALAASGPLGSGELKVGTITLAIGQRGAIRLVREYFGVFTDVDPVLVEEVLEDAFFADAKKGEYAETIVPEASIAGAIDEAFFTRKIKKGGDEKQGAATKG